MKDFALDVNGDLMLDPVTGDFMLVDDPDSITQVANIGLSMQLGEWSQNLAAGFDWERYTMGDQPDTQLLRSALIAFLKASPGITRVNFLNVTRDSVSRTTTIVGEAVDQQGLILPIQAVTPNG